MFSINALFANYHQHTSVNISLDVPEIAKLILLTPNVCQTLRTDKSISRFNIQETVIVESDSEDLRLRGERFKIYSDIVRVGIRAREREEWPSAHQCWRDS